MTVSPGASSAEYNRPGIHRRSGTRSPTRCDRTRRSSLNVGRADSVRHRTFILSLAKNGKEDRDHGFRPQVKPGEAMSNKAAVIHEKGTPDVFRWQDWPVGEPGPGDVLIRHGAIGVNYIDTYNRRGMPHPWPVPPLPFVRGHRGRRYGRSGRRRRDGMRGRRPGHLCQSTARSLCAAPGDAGQADGQAARQHLRGRRRRHHAQGPHRPVSSCAEPTGCSRAMRCWSMRRRAAWG